MLARMLNQKPLIGANFLPPQKSARERAVDRWFLREKPQLRTITTSDKTLPGQYYDEETNLHYNYYRYYDPELGRYITSDPLGVFAGLNTYMYADANPIRYVDPLGLLIGFPGSLPGGGSSSSAVACEAGIEKECAKEIQGCMKDCIRARNNQHRMPDVWGGSWWRCMTGCVSYECQDYIDQWQHGEEEADDRYNYQPTPSPSPYTDPSANPVPWWLYLLFIIPPFGIPG